MFFSISKIFWWFAAPLNALVFLLCIGLLLSAGRWKRAGRGLLFVVACLFLLFGFTRASDLPLVWLEGRYPVPHLDAPPAGIIVLGGGISVSPYHFEAPYYLGSWVDRVTTGLALKRRYPEARLIYSGGSGSLFGAGTSEAESARRLIVDLYGEDLGLEAESRSRTTWENGLYVMERIGPGERDRTWILVTSAWHMSRAMGVFRKLGLDPVAWPTDYKAARLSPPYLDNSAVDQFEKLTIALRELIGLAAYRATGRWAPEPAGTD